MSHYSHMVDESGEGVLYNDVANYEQQIMVCFLGEEDYYLKKYDYLKVIIKDSNDQIVAWYGGSDKYGAF